ncbi:MAG: prepilin-type N-terminal cleavage/methylation domain-containing protein [Planctomycetota bacterium]
MRLPPHVRARGSKAAGFTLLELLIVIAIIAILAAIITPYVLSARKNAKCVQGLSDLRKLITKALSSLNDLRSGAKTLTEALADVKPVCDKFKALKDNGCYKKGRSSTTDSLLAQLGAKIEQLKAELSGSDLAALNTATANCP